jgi:hypothetical protein
LIPRLRYNRIKVSGYGGGIRRLIVELALDGNRQSAVCYPGSAGMYYVAVLVRAEVVASPPRGDPRLIAAVAVIAASLEHPGLSIGSVSWQFE